jgi:hypothetical protein
MASTRMPKKGSEKKFSDPAQVRVKGQVSTHRTGTACIAFHGHFAQVADIEGVTRPTASTQGSHDHLVRGDGSELKGECADVTEQAWTTSAKKTDHKEHGA